MLNPHVYLNPKIFDEDVEQKATRDGFGTGLVKLGDADPNVVVLTADLSESTRTDAFEKKYPNRFFEMGVAEQNMATVAAGLGISGKTAFISSYATFSPGRNWEQIRTTIVYNKSNVKIAGHHSGIMTGPDGATHQATEDVAMMRALPDISVIVPCDNIEGEKATIAAGKIKDAVYLRFSRDKTPVITTDKTPFATGRAQVFWTSANPKVAIVGMGYMLYYCLLAAKKLEKLGIECLVINNPSVKPLDEKLLLDVAKQTGSIVTVEDHQITGGLGGALSELFAKHTPIPMEFVGLQNTFGESGKPRELLTKYKMDDTAIVDAAQKVIQRKK